VAPWYFVAGLLMIALAAGFLAGPWWGVLVAGVELIALGVLEQAGSEQRGRER
jgi:hypothetical protein